MVTASQKVNSGMPAHVTLRNLSLVHAGKSSLGRALIVKHRWTVQILWRGHEGITSTTTQTPLSETRQLGSPSVNFSTLAHIMHQMQLIRGS